LFISRIIFKFTAMLFLAPDHFPDYELLDCGNFEKLERFGKYVLIRPEPQAVWDKGMTEKDWEKRAHVKFISKSSSAGEWKKLKEMPDRWNIEYPIGSPQSTVRSPQLPTLKFRLALTWFKHVGIFPEQAVNWDYIYNRLTGLTPGLSPKERGEERPRFLNLFAYTGGASLAAKAAGADVVHLDSVRQVVTWANENMELSGLKDIRWVVEDAMAFVKREVKRGKKYNGIILDPPAYGRGTDDRKWKLEEMINEMMKHVKELLVEDKCFLILNTYSLGFSSLIVENLLKESTGLETGELFLKSSTGHKLPLGVFGRFLNF
jgi:23S rRNA (cytosine1962-C5)-methyltransferase